jgi:small subunit ribosomal protein S1
MNKEAEGLVSREIDIQWVDEENITAFLRKGKVVVLMKHYQNHDKNVVNAAWHYVQTGVLHNGKRYFTQPLKKAIDLSITKKILCEEEENGTSIEYFSENTLKPELQDKETSDAFQIVEKLEDKGLLTRILLREIKLVGKKLYPQQPDKSSTSETSRFFQFLQPFAEHQGGQDNINQWEYFSTHICMGIMFVARQSKLNEEGLAPYLANVERQFTRGCDRVYVFARGLEKIKAVKLIVQILQRRNGNIHAQFEYFQQPARDGDTKNVCVTLSLKS